MKPLSPAQEARWIFVSAVVVAGSTLLVRRQVDWSDTGVVVIWIVAMLVLTAAVRLFISTNSGEDGRIELEKKFKFFQRIFPPK
jgi:hypothetical protein